MQNPPIFSGKFASIKKHMFPLYTQEHNLQDITERTNGTPMQAPHKSRGKRLRPVVCFLLRSVSEI